MGKLFRNLKPMALMLVIVVVLVASQAVAELYLPEMMSDIINDGIYLEYEPMYTHETMNNPFGEFDITGSVEGFDGDTIPVFEMKDGFSTVDLAAIWNSLYPGEIGFIFKDIPVKDSKELFNEVLIPFMDGLRPYQFDKLNKEKEKTLGRKLDRWENYTKKDELNSSKEAIRISAELKLATHTPDDPTDDYYYTYEDYPADIKAGVKKAVERLIDFQSLIDGTSKIKVDDFLDMFEEKEDGEEEDNVWRENENARHMLVSCIYGMKHSIYNNMLPIPVEADAEGNAILDENGNFKRIPVDAYGMPIDKSKIYYHYDSETERYKPFPDYELILCNEVLGYAYIYNGPKWINNELGTAKSDANVMSMTGEVLKNTDIIVKYIEYCVSVDEAAALRAGTQKDLLKVAKQLKKDGAVIISKDFAQRLYDDGYEYEDIKDNSFFFKLKNYLKLSEVGRSKKVNEKTEDYLIPDGETIQVSNYNFILKKGGIMLSLTVFASICAIAAMFISARIAANFSSVLRSQVFTKVESFSLVEFDKFSTASLITRSTNDINQIQNVFLLILRTALSAPVTIVGGMILSMRQNADMTMVLFYTIPALLIAATVAAKIVYPIIRLIQQKVDQLTLIMRESLTGIRVVRAFNQQKREEKRFALASRTTSRLATIVARYTAILAPLISVGMNVTMVGIIWVASKAIANDTIDDVGTMMAVMQYVTQILFALIMLATVFVQYPRAGASANRINQVMETDVSIKDSENAKDLGQGKGRVEFKNVYFKYTPEAEKYILEDISFKCEPGKVLAIIGGTGSGKSSIINLIPRFYEATKGEIYINGQPIQDIPLAELRAKIGFIPQKSMLFSGTIRENLRYGKEDASDEEIWEALRIAQSDSFVRDKEGGLCHHVEQAGKNFSGGQKQRLSIARAIVRRPEVYIFDDSFSALDFKTDANLRKALKEITKESTVIIVAQRIGTIMDADTILVLDQGKIVGKGCHSDLICKCGTYKDIALSQLSEEELGI